MIFLLHQLGRRLMSYHCLAVARLLVSCDWISSFSTTVKLSRTVRFVRWRVFDKSSRRKEAGGGGKGGEARVSSCPPILAVPLHLLSVESRALPQGRLCFVHNLYQHSETPHAKSPWIQQRFQKHYPWPFQSQDVGFSNDLLNLKSISTHYEATKCKHTKLQHTLDTFVISR